MRFFTHCWQYFHIQICRLWLLSSFSCRLNYLILGSLEWSWWWVWPGHGIPTARLSGLVKPSVPALVAHTLGLWGTSWDHWSGADDGVIICWWGRQTKIETINLDVHGWPSVSSLEYLNTVLMMSVAHTMKGRAHRNYGQNKSQYSTGWMRGKTSQMERAICLASLCQDSTTNQAKFAIEQSSLQIIFK